MLSEFAKDLWNENSDAYVQVAHLHNAARALSISPSGNTRAKRLRMRKVSIFKMAVVNANFTKDAFFWTKIELY